MLNNASIINVKKSNSRKLKSEIDYRKDLQDICNKIHAAANLDEILVDLKDEITRLFEAERLTVYVIDGKKRELVSRFKSGNEIEEIRISMSNSSISGCSAFKKKIINIKNVYDDSELASIDPELKFDKRWDKKMGFWTQQVLAVPIIFKKFLLGVIQLINRKGGGSFARLDDRVDLCPEWRDVFRESFKQQAIVRLSLTLYTGHVQAIFVVEIADCQ